MSDPLIDRIRQLRKTREVWDGEILRVPQWLAEEGKAPVRPWLGIWVNAANGKISTSGLRRPHEKGFDALLEAFAPPGSSIVTGTRPEKVRVRTPGLAEFLRQKLEGLIEVELVDDLPAIEMVKAQMRQSMKASPVPDALSVAGITVPALELFYAAASLFFDAEPWRHLSDEDYIRIESPTPPSEGLQGLTVMGAQGRTFGLAFYKDRQQHIELHQTTDMMKFYRKHGGIWSIIFDEITALPTGDADLFEDGILPAPPSPKAYPVAKLYRGGVGQISRPNPAELAFFEAILRALAEITEEELDSARWSKRVVTSNGEVEVALSLPELLEEPKAPTTSGPSHTQLREMERALDRLQRAATDKEFNTSEEAQAYLDQLQRETAPDANRQPTPTERAQDLVDIAWQSWGRRRKQLIRQALAIDPNCPEAYVLLGAIERDAARALEHYKQAVAAGERSIGPEALQENAGDLWVNLRTRPYMRARMALAENLRELGRNDEAIEHFKELIRLNLADQQGTRLRLLACLLEKGDDAQLEALFNRFDGEKAALWAYGRALWKFRREGDTGNARKEMWAALDANHFAPNYLLKKKEMPAGLPSAYTPNSEAEGVLIALELGDAFEATPNAIHWLTEQKRKKRDRDDRKRHER
jgi:tetratricopeptide (TPR) repeat protein